MRFDDIIKAVASEKAKSTTVDIKPVENATSEKASKAFYRALANKDTNTLRNLQSDIAEGYRKAYNGQSVKVDEDGGFLVPVELASQINTKIVDISPIRQVATVISNLPAKLSLPFEKGLPTSYWVEEGVAPTQSKSTFEKIDLVPSKLGAFAKFTHESLTDTSSIPDLQNFVAQRFAVSMAQKENEAFINGDGANKPKGLTKVTPKTTVNLATAGTLTYQDIVNCYYGIGATSRANAVWLAHSSVLATLVGLTDNNGRPLYQPAMAEGVPATILGRPVFEVNELPNTAKNGEIWFGDMKNYIIGDREGLRVTFGTTGNDLESDIISLVMFKRVAGVPTVGDAFAKIAKV